MAESKKTGLTTFHLKLIAIVTMCIDHTAAVFSDRFPSDVYMYMRCIGRIAFPIYCFLLVEGFTHTRSRGKYACRLGLFCLLSEPCYDIAFHGEWIYADSQNVFWTLLLGFVMMAALDALRKWKPADGARRVPIRLLSAVAAVAVTVAVVAAAACLRTDYSYKGILMILAFYCFRNQRVCALTAVSLVDLFAFARLNVLSVMYSYQMPFSTIRASLTSFYIQDAALVAILPISLYNGEKGRSLKWFFYVFYPAHLLVLYALGRQFIWR